MKNDELLDLVNDKDEVIGTVWKSEAHQNPNIIHREIAVAVFNKKGEVLIQRRSMNKSNPGSWKITAAGHVKFGEDPKLATVREVREELGLNIDPIYFEKRRVTKKDKESRFFWIYYAVIKKDQPLKLDESEVMDARWVKIDDLKKYLDLGKYSMDSLSYQTMIDTSKLI